MQAYNNATGAQVLSASQTGTSRSVTFDYATPYRWRVLACNANGCSAYAAYRYFQTPAAPIVETHTSFLSLGGMTLVQIATSGTSSTPTYLHPDLLGSPRRATNNLRQSLWREHYDPYGRKLNGVNSKLGYTGHAHDSETGLTYMQARHYDPLVGRFLSPDPVRFTPENPYGFNRYAYGNNNPYRYYDPDGRCTGSRITTDDNRCEVTGGFTTGLDGAAQGAAIARANKAINDFVTAITSGTSSVFTGESIMVADASTFNTDVCTTLVCRPTSSVANHCATFVSDCGDPSSAQIEAQFSLQGGATTFDPQGSASYTYQTDLGAFLNPGGSNLHYSIAPPGEMSARQFADSVIRHGNGYQAPRYGLIFGPNSNSAAAFPLYRSGAQVPDVPRAPALHYWGP